MCFRYSGYQDELKEKSFLQDSHGLDDWTASKQLVYNVMLLVQPLWYGKNTSAPWGRHPRRYKSNWDLTET